MESATLSPPPAGSAAPGRAGADGSSTWARPTWAKLAFALLCVAALAGYFAFPTYPTYDSFYALLWGRDLLHLQLPDFSVYRGPTEHPLAIAFGMLCSLFGQGGARLMVLGSIGSFVALTAGIYRLTRLCFGTLVAVLAAALLLSRLFDANLAAQGYLDLTYIALIVWATALEVERPRRGTLVFVLLAAAGLLRPDAWVLSGVYWLWCAWPALGVAALARERRSPMPAPAVRAARRVERRATRDRAVSSRQAPRLHGAGGDRAGRVGRARHDRDGRPALLAALDGGAGGRTGTHAGLLGGARRDVALRRADRQAAGRRGGDRRGRDRVVADAAPHQGAVGGARAAAARVRGRGRGGGVGDRPLHAGLLGAAAAVLRAGDRRLVAAARRLAAAARVDGGRGGARALRGAGGGLGDEPDERAHDALLPRGLPRRARARRCTRRRCARELARCPLLSLPDNKLIPDARWILETSNQRDIVARSEARADAQQGDDALADRIRRGSVAVYPLGAAVFQEAIVDVGDDPLDQVPLPGFRRIYTSRYYAVYGNC